MAATFDAIMLSGGCASREAPHGQMMAARPAHTSSARPTGGTGLLRLGSQWLPRRVTVQSPAPSLVVIVRTAGGDTGSEPGVCVHTASITTMLRSHQQTPHTNGSDRQVRRTATHTAQDTKLILSFPRLPCQLLTNTGDRDKGPHCALPQQDCSVCSTHDPVRSRCFTQRAVGAGEPHIL